ncbi:MAG: hypothetical protein ACK53Y_15045, partial [bacterium]
MLLLNDNRSQRETRAREETIGQVLQAHNTNTNWMSMTPQQSSHMGDSMCNPPISDRILVILLGSIFCLATFIMTSRPLK